MSPQTLVSDKVIDGIKEEIKVHEAALESLYKTLRILSSAGGQVRRGFSSSGPRYSWGKRKPELIAYLTKHGPSTRQEMAKGMGAPIGTIDTVLRDKEAFIRNHEGKWTVKQTEKPVQQAAQLPKMAHKEPEKETAKRH